MLTSPLRWFFSNGGSGSEVTPVGGSGGGGGGGERAVTDAYTIGSELGAGTVAVVRAVRCKETGMAYALKTISKDRLDEGQLKYLEAECEALKRIDAHPNIAKLHEIYDTPKRLYIVMEQASGGQLLERLATKGLYSEGVTATCIRSIADAVAYCHSKGVVHRDLKPENILLSDATDEACIKLVDFGAQRPTLCALRPAPCHMHVVGRATAVLASQSQASIGASACGVSLLCCCLMAPGTRTLLICRAVEAVQLGDRDDVHAGRQAQQHRLPPPPPPPWRQLSSAVSWLSVGCQLPHCIWVGVARCSLTLDVPRRRRRRRGRTHVRCCGHVGGGQRVISVARPSSWLQR
jgi:serine/threonine protein kinase